VASSLVFVQEGIYDEFEEKKNSGKGKNLGHWRTS